MKKITFLLVAVLAFAMSARAEFLTFNWAHMVDGATTAGDNVVTMLKASDSNLIVVTSFGTRDDSQYVSFDGTTIAGVDGQPIIGGTYDTSAGNSYNRNLLVQKVGADGTVKWMLYSKKGDVDQNSVYAATNDGGFVGVIKTRAWQAGDGLDNLIEIVDSKGATTTIKDMGTVSGEYRFLMVKISSEGVLEWSRLISGYVDPTITKTATKDNAYVNGLAVDENNNIYLGGNFRTQLNFKKSDGTTVTLTAKNNVGWTGDSQSVIGDLFLAKFDADGYYENCLLADGTATLAFVDCVAYIDGKIYFNGRVTGDGTTIKLGDYTINASTTLQTAYICSVNASDLSVNYVTTLPSVANKKNRFVLQNKNVQVIDGKLYFTGLINGGWRLEGAESDLINTNDAQSQLKGYVLEFDPTTGAVGAAGVLTTSGISAFFGVYPGDQYFYAFGYNMTSGALLQVLDKVTLEPLGSGDVICKYGTVAMCGAPVYDTTTKTFFMMNRGRANATFLNTDVTLSGSYWGAVYYSYTIDETLANVSSIKANNGNVNYDVYTTTGIRLKAGATSMEEAKAGLDNGIYIIGGEKVSIYNK